MKPKISVCLPVRNGADTILETIQSVLAQSFKDFELVIVDNVSTDNTLEIVRSVKDKRIKLYQNKKNVGTGGNLQMCQKRARTPFIFYICADDIVDRDALQKVYQAFQIAPDIGIVSRPYYWFLGDFKNVVRAKKQFSRQQIVSISSDPAKVADLADLADQISGMAFRKKYLKGQFGNQNFIEMASMVLRTLKYARAVILKDNLVAVRTRVTGYGPNVLKESPMKAWRRLIESTYRGKKYAALRRCLIKEFVATNYIGLVQIKNFASLKILLGEIFCLLTWRWRNFLSPAFWFFALGCLLVPKFLLRRLVVLYKRKVRERCLAPIKINLAK